MKNYHISFFLIAVAMLMTCFGSAIAENPNYPTNNGYPVKCNFGYKKIATPTFTITETEMTEINDYLPTGTIGFTFRCASGSFIVGHGDNIATGTNRIGALYSEGESYTWNGLAGTFNGKIMSNLSTSTVVIDGAWGEWSNNDL